MDISAEIAAIQAASQGSELRQPLVGALNKLNSGSLPAVTSSDVGKILKVGANGWEVGEKSGYMPIPTATKQITENGTHDVTDYASVVVNVSGGGGSVLIPKTITQNGIYDPTDDNADGYSEVTVNVGSGNVVNLAHFNGYSYSAYNTPDPGVSISASGDNVGTTTFNGIKANNNTINMQYQIPDAVIKIYAGCKIRAVSNDSRVGVAIQKRLSPYTRYVTAYNGEYGTIPAITDTGIVIMLFITDAGNYNSVQGYVEIVGIE